MDFTINTYTKLLEALLKQGFVFYRVCEFDANCLMQMDAKRFVVLRQDVDKLPGNALSVARIQKEMGVRSTFYFRTVPGSFSSEIIEEIAGLGHEVGYHYEDISLAASSSRFQVPGFKFSEKDLIEESIGTFNRNLKRLREYADVRSICMHGSPMSRWDSRLLWKYYDYREFGLECEPYFDIDFSRMLYLTDTGRRWNGSGVSVRDKAQGSGRKVQDGGRRYGERERRRENIQDTRHKIQVEQGSTNRNLEHGTLNMEPFADWKVKPVPGSLMNITSESAEFQDRYNFRATKDIIQATEQGQLPNKMMMTFHPQRWTNKPMPWVKELVWQNTKNVAKYILIQIRSK